MHKIQEKILEVMDSENLSGMTLRRIGELIGEPDKPQKVKHHLLQLEKKGLIKNNAVNNTITKVKSGIVEGSNLISIPILGSANCGVATIYAENRLEGYLKLSSSLLEFNSKNTFAIKAVGNSMNRAAVGKEGLSIDEGDYVLIDGNNINPQNGDYVLSIIDGVANIKKILIDEENKRITLFSMSTQDYPPIFIAKDDFSTYMVNGVIVQIIKNPKF